MVGFLHFIDQRLIDAAPRFISKHDRELLKEANSGIDSDDKAYLESLSFEEQFDGVTA